MRLRPSNLIMTAIALVVAPATLTLLTCLLASAGAFGFMPLAIVGAIAAPFACSLYLGRARSGGELELVDSGVRVETGRTDRNIVFARILSGYAMPKKDTVVLCLSNGARITAVLAEGTPSEVVAHCLSQRAPTLALRGQLGAFTRGLLAFMGSCFFALPVALMLIPRIGGWGILVVLLAAIVATVFTVKFFGSPRIVVGKDGVRLLGVLRPAFIPYSAISRVERASPGLLLHLENGRTLPLPTIAQGGAQVSDLIRRIADGIDEYGEGEVRLADVLARNGQTLKAWKEAIARVAVSGGNFRTHQLGREDFEVILADASATAERRIAAALALQALDETGAGERIRVASATLANDRLRVALDAAREGVLDEALVDAACGEGGRHVDPRVP